MATGSVKWFDSKKGFGFIIGPEGQDVFVHFTMIQGEGFRSLKDGESVEYEFERGPKGILARNVRRLATENAKAEPIRKKAPARSANVQQESPGEQAE